VWAKADLLSHVSFGRLDRVLDGGKYCSPRLNPTDLKGIQLAVWEALGRPAIQPTKDTENTVVKIVEARVETTQIVVDKLSKGD
jgi:hypothetical protein